MKLPSGNTEEIVKQAKVLQLINLYRVRGHLIADLDPLGSKTQYHAELDPSSYNLTIWDLDRHFITGGFRKFKYSNTSGDIKYSGKNIL